VQVNNSTTPEVRVYKIIDSVFGFLREGFRHFWVTSWECPIDNAKLMLQSTGAPTTFPLTLYKQYGLAPFFRGNLAKLLRFIPAKCVEKIFSAIEEKNNEMKDPNVKPGIMRRVMNCILSPGIGGTVLSVVSLFPFDVVKTLMVHDFAEEKYNGFGQCLSLVVHERGFMGLFSGLIACFLNILVYRLLEYYLNIVLREYLKRQQTFTSGLVITFISGLIAYPFDTIRRIQIINGDNFTSAARFIYNTRGFTGFFSGSLYFFLKLLNSHYIFIK